MRVSIYDALDRLVGQGVPLSEALRANQDVALVALAETRVPNPMPELEGKWSRLPGGDQGSDGKGDQETSESA